MSFGEMNTFIVIIAVEQIKDAEGFPTTTDRVLARVRAYREDRHGDEKWANRAAYSTATALFRFRRIPGLYLDTSCFIDCADNLAQGVVRYRIHSVENVKGRGMYYEVLAEKLEPTVR